jgi:hypothetical protein
MTLAERLVPPLAAWDSTWRYPESGVAWWTMTPAMRAVYDWVRANYSATARVGPHRWVAYHRVAGPKLR